MIDDPSPVWMPKFCFKQGAVCFPQREEMHELLLFSPPATGLPNGTTVHALGPTHSKLNISCIAPGV